MPSEHLPPPKILLLLFMNLNVFNDKFSGDAQVGWQESQRGWGDGQDNLKVTAMEMLQTDANIVQKFSPVGWVWRFTFKSHSGAKSLVVHMVTTQLRECWQMQKLCKSFLMSEEFKGSHGHYTLEIGLHVNYVLKRILVKTTWRCTWKHLHGNIIKPYKMSLIFIMTMWVQ